MTSHLSNPFFLFWRKARARHKKSRTLNLASSSIEINSHHAQHRAPQSESHASREFAGRTASGRIPRKRRRQRSRERKWRRLGETPRARSRQPLPLPPTKQRRRSEQRASRARATRARREIEVIISSDRTKLLSQEIQKEKELDRSTKQALGFIPDTTITPFRNASRLIANNPINTPILPFPSNLSFHDLTPDKSIPPQAKYLLGLGSKFIPTPSTTNGRLTNSLDRIARDLKLRVYFACDDSDDEDERDPASRSKLYLKSKWTPKDSQLPSWVNGRLDRFASALSTIFKRRKAIPNLLPLQQELLESIPLPSCR